MQDISWPIYQTYLLVHQPLIHSVLHNGFEPPQQKEREHRFLSYTNYWNSYSVAEKYVKLWKAQVPPYDSASGKEIGKIKLVEQ